jgi:uncharacterized protein (DUF305 family)
VQETPVGPRRRGLRELVLVAAAACPATTLALLLVLGTSGAPATDSPEAGFARDMATHHAQAAEMAFVIRDASADDRLRALAYDIIVTQTAQRGVFMGWLQQWGAPQPSPGPRMAWMSGHSHGAPGAPMPGMASDFELQQLRQASGRDAEILFLQLMIRHHEGGLEMARAILAQSSRDEVAAMARNIESSQAGEIALMKDMLTERGGRLP